MSPGEALTWLGFLLGVAVIVAALACFLAALYDVTRNPSEKP